MTEPNPDYSLGTEELPEAELDTPAGSGHATDGIDTSHTPRQEAQSIPIPEDIAARRDAADVMEPSPVLEDDQPAALDPEEEEEALHGSVTK